MTGVTDLIDMVHNALVGVGCEPIGVHPGLWKLGGFNNGLEGIEIRAEDGWFRADVTFPSEVSRAISSETAASINASLAGSCKIMLSPRTGEMGLRAESAIDCEADPAPAVRNCIGVLAGAWGQFVNGTQSPPTSVLVDTQSAIADLVGVCEEAGWDLKPKTDGTLEALLPGRGQEFHQTTVSVSTRPPGIVMKVELMPLSGISGASREAAASLLLAAGGVVRFVRGAFFNSKENLSAGFQLALPLPASAFEATHALAALTVACRICARELPLLRDEQLANAYLAVVAHSEPSAQSRT